MSRGVESYEQRVAESMAGRKWILCADVAAALTPVVRQLADDGAPRPLVLAGSPGTGPQPEEADAEVVLLGIEGASMMDGIRRYHAALRDLPGWVVDRIEAWDPDGEALVLPSFLDTALEIAGRRSWAARKPEWVALEDKTVADAIWDGAGVDRAPSLIVDCEEAPLVEAAKTLDSGAGTVWSGDNREGWHGGAEYTRFVADADDAAPTIAFMRRHAGRARVMPFLEGVPCSIHAMVFPDDVAVFRPVEMVVFRVPGSDLFRYASVSTSWDPPPAIREQMRDVGRRVGAHLRDLVGFRGALTVDGVATAEGFLPTELNPRFGAGLAPVARTSGLPLLGISRLLIAGADDLDAADIERLAVEASDSHRTLFGFTLTARHDAEPTEQRLDVRDDGVVEAAADGGNATLSLGPSPAGSMVRLVVDPEAVTAGIFAAPVVAAAFGVADRLWDTGIGPLIPATPAG